MPKSTPRVPFELMLAPVSLQSAYTGALLALLTLAVSVPIALLATSHWDLAELLSKASAIVYTDAEGLVPLILHPDVLLWTEIGVIFLLFWSSYGVAVIVLPFSLIGAAVFAFAVPAFVPFLLPLERTGVRALMQSVCTFTAARALSFFVADIAQEWHDLGVAEGIIKSPSGAKESSESESASVKHHVSHAVRRRRQPSTSTSDEKQPRAIKTTSGMLGVLSPQSRRVFRLVRRLFLRPYLWRHLEARFPESRIHWVTPMGSTQRATSPTRSPNLSPQSSLHILRTGLAPPKVAIKASSPTRAQDWRSKLPSPASSGFLTGETSLLGMTIGSVAGGDGDDTEDSDVLSLWSADSEGDADAFTAELIKRSGSRGGDALVLRDSEDKNDDADAKGDHKHESEQEEAEAESPDVRVEPEWDSVEWRLRQVYTYFDLRHETVPSPFPTVYQTISHNFAFVTEMILGILLVTLFSVSHDSIRHGLWPFLSSSLPYPVAVVAFYLIRWTLNQATLFSCFGVLDGVAGLVCIASNRLPIYPVHDAVEQAGSLTSLWAKHWNRPMQMWLFEHWYRPVNSILRSWPLSLCIPSKLRKMLAVWSTFGASAGFHAWIIVVAAWGQPYMQIDSVKMFMFFIIQPVLMFVEQLIGIETVEGHRKSNGDNHQGGPTSEETESSKSQQSSANTETGTDKVERDAPKPDTSHQSRRSRKKLPHWMGVLWTTISIWLLSGPLVVEPVLHLMGV
ncbi:hypothetical protein M427DRAFT_151770 [Gonapodya prolifera JEL478]|uniref:Uncharacterized protein n=1 Tax=Gonapodya prolifera (strain JEL478) TaxID=1344416 RepID=A0A139AUH2_GONPJ|nr:hypothetical protein M427DRAFT_151770 [Gonapodya prolifera JEL478]|eukprot:KXS20390.1 hypothetical protein M427DRAFT_151770 [Gonapodya prolifera JEL478]